MKELVDKIKHGYSVDEDDIDFMIGADYKDLALAANQIRKHFMKNSFDMCSIINGKSGRCSENCKFCAQSAHYKTDIEEYDLLDSSKIIERAIYNRSKGVKRFSIVTSGRKLCDTDIEKICQVISYLAKETDVKVCGSFGLLDYENYKKLKEAGLLRVHNNLETSRENFSSICTSHTYDDKITAIKNALKADLQVCSGGIIGLGESMRDRINMALEIKKLGIKSVPINILSPIANTPFEKNPPLDEAEIIKTIAIFRLILTDAYIRLAGGRGQLADYGKTLFESGANAAITGDMLTTKGITIDGDKKLVTSIGYEISYE